MATEQALGGELPHSFFVITPLHLLEKATSGFDVPLETCVIKVPFWITPIARADAELLQRCQWQATPHKAMIDREHPTCEANLGTRPDSTACWIIIPRRRRSWQRHSNTTTQKRTLPTMQWKA